MDKKSALFSDWDGSSLTSEIDEDLTNTFCTCPEESRLEITRFYDQVPGNDEKGMGGASGQPRSVVGFAELEYLAVCCYFREILS
jgi:hypothetical protein